MDKVTKKQINSHTCFICGTENNAGLNARFYETEKGEVACIFTPRQEHQSYPGRLHGGVSAAILDELIGRAIMIKEPNTWGVTCELNVKYKKPVPLDISLKAVGRITDVNRKLFKAEGEIYLPNGDIAVIASGLYMKLPIEKIVEGTGVDMNDEVFVIEGEDNPEYI